MLQHPPVEFAKDYGMGEMFDPHDGSDVIAGDRCIVVLFPALQEVEEGEGLLQPLNREYIPFIVQRE